MTWKTEYNDELQIVVLTYTGEITGNDIKEAAAARIKMGRRKGVEKYLIDTREVQTDSSATLDIYEVPTRIYPNECINQRSHIAIIKPELPAATRMVRFFVDTCVNRGWSVKMFEDHESAVKWLQQEACRQSPA